ncbi:MAG: hypothetical protein AAGJ18_13860 [Bacteroidota bacterium]
MLSIQCEIKEALLADFSWVGLVEGSVGMRNSGYDGKFIFLKLFKTG